MLRFVSLSFLVLALLACGHEPTAPQPTVTASAPNGPCTITKKLIGTDGRIWWMTAYASVCPSDETLAALGWTKVP